MTKYVRHGGLEVAAVLDDFVAREALPGLSLTPEAFWSAFEAILTDLAATAVQSLNHSMYAAPTRETGRINTPRSA